MSSVVAEWSGHEARALRVAMRLSVRDFAAHLGLNYQAVSTWERRGRRGQLRHETQQMLDVVFKTADPDVKERFWLLVHRAAEEYMGAKSTERTKFLLCAAQPYNHPLQYVPDTPGLDTFRRFLASTDRVFVLTGPPGCGKTQFAHHIAVTSADCSDFQLHQLDAWDSNTVDLAAEILRFASLPGGDDPLLTLESASAGLGQPCVVIIDGINTNNVLDRIARQVDSVLRQVSADALRFLLVVRTPPEVDLSAYPVLAASVYEPAASNPRLSYQMTLWDLATARDIWEQSRNDGEPPFYELPSSVQQLTRRPLYMQLLKSTGNTVTSGELSTFRLIDHCVREVLRRTTHPVEQAITRLAHLACLAAPELIPQQLGDEADPVFLTGHSRWLDGTTALPALLLPSSSEQRPVFVHDVIREYFLAITIVRAIQDRGRTAGTVAALNELATQATTSATARGVVEFVIDALDTVAPELAAALAVAPAIAVDPTLPLLLGLAPRAARFATDEVLRTCAKRSAQEPGIELARALLTWPTIADALAGDYPPWVLGLLHRFGSLIWPDVAHHLERTLNVQASTQLLAYVNLDRAEDAIFLARYFYLFTSGHRDQAELLELLLGHPDWRVRAGLADGLRASATVSEALARRITRQLVQDPDYKVQAAIAHAVGHLPSAVAQEHLAALLAENNWHVRARLLEGILGIGASSPVLPALRRSAIQVMASDASWIDSPRHVAKLRERLLLLEQLPSAGIAGARERALFRLLRELRTGRLTLPDQQRDNLIAEGRTSHGWLVQREITALTEHATADIDGASLTSERDRYRRLRDGSFVQIALDLHDLSRALVVAAAAAQAGADFIEVGDPLIKTHGVNAIEHVKRHIPDTLIVAEMMSADWGRDQVELAAEAGADVVLLIGPASTASVSAAAEAARRLGVALLLDIPAPHASAGWVRDMERAGVDGFTITTNIDLGVGVHAPLTTVRAVRNWTRLPLAVSGGFSTTDHAIMTSTDWDIMIVGRSVGDAVNPLDAARQLTTLIHQRGARLSSARDTPS